MVAGSAVPPWLSVAVNVKLSGPSAAGAVDVGAPTNGTPGPSGVFATVPRLPVWSTANVSVSSRSLSTQMRAPCHAAPARMPTGGLLLTQYGTSLLPESTSIVHVAVVADSPPRPVALNVKESR